MKQFYFNIWTVLCTLLVSITVASASYAVSDHASQNVIIWFKTFDVVDDALEELGPAFALTHRYEHVPGVAGKITKEGLERLRDDTRVQGIFADEELHVLLNQSRRTVGAHAMESYGYTGRQQTACVLDTGVDYTHPALVGWEDGRGIMVWHCR